MIYLVAGKLNLFCPKEQKTELLKAVIEDK